MTILGVTSIAEIDEAPRTLSLSTVDIRLCLSKAQPQHLPLLLNRAPKYWKLNIRIPVCVVQSLFSPHCKNLAFLDSHWPVLRVGVSLQVLTVVYNSTYVCHSIAFAFNHPCTKYTLE